MSWMPEWRALSARMDAVLRAGQILLTANKNDHFSQGTNAIVPDALAVVDRVVTWAERYRSYLAPEILAAVNKYQGEAGRLRPAANGFQGVLGLSIVLAGLQGELTFLLSDVEAATASSVIRALQHLQRSIISDPEVQRRWADAFSKGEVECEKLGATHVLSHRIWAFKADATGERTDLVLGTVIAEDDVAAAGASLVLTEWKVVRDAAALDSAVAQARRQATIYAGSSLAAVELRSIRYIVVVSRDRLAMPSDVEIGGVRYEHRNIAVEPSVPSKAKAV